MSGQGQQLGSEDAERAQTLAHFQQLTGLEEDRCVEYLEPANWDIGRAAQAFYLDEEQLSESRPDASATEEYTGPRTLDGRPAPEALRNPRSSSSRAAAPQKKKGLATLSSLASSSNVPGDDDDDDDDDMGDNDDGRNPRDLFAGGEKSGLAVQDPTQEGSGAKKILKDILAKARANEGRPGADSPAGPSSSSFFRGSGQTLGGDGVESRVIPDPSSATPGRPSAGNEDVQERVLHLWHDGFSIDDGELRRFDDPNNANDLNAIRSGRAPLQLLNVRPDQPVDVKLQQHDENYQPQPKAYKPFGGTGHRLGSEVPGDGSSSSSPAPPPVSSTAPAAPSASTGTSAAPTTSVDESQPTLTLRIQLPDGTRLPARFNTTHTLDDVYGFVERASTSVRSRPWVLATTFPNKDHTDRSLVLGDIPEFKRGGTAVVKWA
ncbi:SEP-domain-containing protein [Sodiomyces alkalinus F11]|uniref:SEP-domain-containing protein n=1 Tax=Sodiomyces alkalinus (strain CBS 110278 / VKM F-3762 / F11) TaxID=1314773 RepID=A0A3N2PXG4_SODAK|nr:SEP-domain-containing protein [Sodiomyces alkalinus F11]ROT39035.1 SEP-domain-containing protein [Sodiomyces alkalinus F11]